MYEWQFCVLWEASDVDSSLVILILDINSHSNEKILYYQDSAKTCGSTEGE